MEQMKFDMQNYTLGDIFNFILATSLFLSVKPNARLNLAF